MNRLMFVLSRIPKAYLAAAGFVLLIFFNNAFFIVEQTEQAVVLQFGKPVRYTEEGKELSFIDKPGLRFKIPFIQEVKYFDSRILTFEATDKEVLDIDKKNLTVNAFAKYRISDPLTFYEKVTDETGINDKLDKIFEAALRNVIGKIPLSNMLSEKRKEAMKSLNESIIERAKDFGIQVVDVRIVRADLPAENSAAIYQRMRAEREKEAKEFRAQGEEQAQIIRSKSDKEALILVSEAKKKALIMRGEGDAIAAKTYANAYNQDPEFYRFYRAMQALSQGLDKESTTLVLSPDSDLLKYLNKIHGSSQQ